MSDKIVTLARFFDPMAAQLVRNRLEAEGIPAFLSGDEASNLFGGMNGAFGTVHVQVSEENLQRATDLLEADEEDLDENEASDSTSSTGRDAVRKKPRQDDIDGRAPSTHITTAPKPKRSREPEEDEQESPPLVWGPDQYADRAWRAAVLGLFFFPVQFYSIWLLCRLTSLDEDLSPAGMRKLYGAVLFNIIAFVLFFIVLVRIAAS